MNYGTFGLTSEYSGLLSGVNYQKVGTLTSSSPPKKIFFKSRNGGKSYGIRYSSYIDKIFVIQYIASLYADIYIVNPNNNSLEKVLTSPTNDLGGLFIEFIENKAYIFYTNTSFFKIINLDTLEFTNQRISTNGLGCYGGMYSLLTNNIYLSNYNSNNITVIDKTNLSLVATIPNTTGVVYSLPIDSLNRLYVSCFASNSLKIYNLTTLNLITEITNIPFCYNSAYCPTNNCLYVPAYNGNSVKVIDCNSDTLIFSISIPNSKPFVAKYNPSNNLIYVTLTDAGENAVVTINPTSNTVISFYKEVISPYDLDFCSSNNKMYLCTFESNSLIEL